MTLFDKMVAEEKIRHSSQGDNAQHEVMQKIALARL